LNFSFSGSFIEEVLFLDLLFALFFPSFWKGMPLAMLFFYSYFLLVNCFHLLDEHRKFKPFKLRRSPTFERPISFKSSSEAFVIATASI
jgi:hypothetical protein